MGRLSERLVVARQALATLRELPLDGTPPRVERDAAIQRFEYTLEALWKGAQSFLREHEGLDVASPKAAVRAAHQTGLLSAEEARIALAMVDDRNRTVHMYREAVATDVFSRLSSYARVMESWLARMEAAGG
jgi:nucleotidyltransferase substrate binding protein (TIGR01987 family)